jgi:predicted TIM-barrel fold metal-dependent hydrolase
MDEHYEILRFQVPWLRMKPSDYFLRQCYTSFEPDETRLGEVISSVGADRVLFASDYPHWDAKLSGSPQAVMERPDLNIETQRKIMGENAARLLRLD